MLLGRKWEPGIAILEDDILSRQSAFQNQAFTERRKEPRLAIAVPARYKHHQKGLWWKHAYTLDISQNGLRLATQHPFSVGQGIQLKVKLPEISKPFRLEGIVVWVKPSERDPSLHTCGVALENLRRASRKEKLIGFMAERLCDFAATTPWRLTCAPAETLEELKAAYRLVYKEYLLRGYCRANSSQMHFNVFCLWPETRTFLLKKNEQLVGTISLLMDSPAGLPIEPLFPEEIAALKAPQKSFAEVGMLALDRELFPKRSFSLTDFQKLVCSFYLFKLMFEYARWKGVTDLVIAVHPKHKELYRFLCFQEIGPVRSYEGACGKPALLMHLDAPRAEKELSVTHASAARYFLKQPTAVNILEKYFVWTGGAVKDLLSEALPLGLKFSEVQRNYLERCYPDLKL